MHSFVHFIFFIFASFYHSNRADKICIFKQVIYWWGTHSSFISIDLVWCDLPPIGDAMRFDPIHIYALSLSLYCYCVWYCCCGCCLCCCCCTTQHRFLIVLFLSSVNINNLLISIYIAPVDLIGFYCLALTRTSYTKC